jgi:hypothetical protein
LNSGCTSEYSTKELFSLSVIIFVTLLVQFVCLSVCFISISSTRNCILCYFASFPLVVLNEENSINRKNLISKKEPYYLSLCSTGMMDCLALTVSSRRRPHFLVVLGKKLSNTTRMIGGNFECFRNCWKLLVYSMNIVMEIQS